jgi:hypothetical protein
MITNSKPGQRVSKGDIVCSNVLTQDSLDSIEKKYSSMYI